MSGHDTNTIFFNKKDKNWTFRTLASQPPTPLRPITSHCFALPSPPHHHPKWWMLYVYRPLIRHLRAESGI